MRVAPPSEQGVDWITPDRIANMSLGRSVEKGSAGFFVNLPATRSSHEGASHPKSLTSLDLGGQGLELRAFLPSQPG